MIPDKIKGTTPKPIVQRRSTMKKKPPKNSSVKRTKPNPYKSVLSEIVDVLHEARRLAARSVNVVITAAYWQIGRRIVEFEQGGAERAQYGTNLLRRLSVDLTQAVGRGFSVDNLENMRQFYLVFRSSISETASRNFPPAISETASRNSAESPATAKTPISPEDSQANPQSPACLDEIPHFPLPWSHYVELLSVASPDAREFYETEALRNGWTVRELERQICTLFFERTLASRNKVAMLEHGADVRPEDIITPENQFKDPLLLEFLGLKDEYSENDLEEALILQLESFLLELGGDFAYIGRQRRLRIGNQWYRIDLLLYHRRLRCLVIIDLKLDKFTHADAGQMTLYLNYARKHWTHPDENPPVGLILCTRKNDAVAHYSLDGMTNKILASEYRTKLPDEKTLITEIKRSRKILEARIRS
jgi:predicted nuclease of restriction endonuclease-like (RecB) superfamily